jgi:LysR family cys regulon transcriptional activator
MTLTQLRYLVAILDAKLNISLAASNVNATQPGLSKQLKLLEDELGFPIFVRRGKALDRVSAGGAEIIERARAILIEVENIRTVAANHRNDTLGELRIATTTTQSRFLLPLVLGRLSLKFPQVGIRIASAGANEALALLDRDQTDLAIVSNSGEVPSGEIALPLYRWDWVLLAPPAHRLASLGRAPTLEDLAPTALVTYGADLLPGFKTDEVFRARGLEPTVAFTCADSDTIKTCVRSGMGVGLLSEVAVSGADDDLVRIPALGLFPPGTTWAVIRRDRVRRDYLLELLGALAPSLTREQIRGALLGDGELSLEHHAPPWPLAYLKDAPQLARAS